jgi:hypothetical protein
LWKNDFQAKIQLIILEIFLDFFDQSAINRRKFNFLPSYEMVIYTEPDLLEWLNYCVKTGVIPNTRVTVSNAYTQVKPSLKYKDATVDQVLNVLKGSKFRDSFYSMMKERVSQNQQSSISSVDNFGNGPIKKETFGFDFKKDVSSPLKRKI